MNFDQIIWKSTISTWVKMRRNHVIRGLFSGSREHILDTTEKIKQIIELYKCSVHLDNWRLYTPEYARYTWRTGGIYTGICSVYLENWRYKLLNMLCTVYLENWRYILLSIFWIPGKLEVYIYYRIVNMLCIPGELEVYTPEYALYTWRTGGIYSRICSVYLKNWRYILLSMFCICIFYIQCILVP